MASAALRRPALAAFFSAISRRAFLALGMRSVIGSALATVLAPLRSAFAGTPPTVRFAHRIVTPESRTSSLIEWQSGERLFAPRVLWRETGTQEETIADAEESRLDFDGQTIFLYRARLSGLSPGKTYEYRVQASGRTEGAVSFRTDDGGECAALIFPDSQCDGDYGTWARVASQASARHPDAALWVNMGDLVDNGASAYHWRGWRDATEKNIGARVFVPVMGNHECYSTEWTYCRPDVFLALFAAPANGSAKYGRYYYSFDYGPVHFVVLNTQREELAAFAPGLFDEQAAWLARDLAETKQPWRVALMHRDLIDYDATLIVRDAFVETLVPLLEAGGIDAALTAHAHAYRRRCLRAWQRDKGGVLYILTGNAGNCFYDVGTHELDEIALPSSFVNYLVMEADESRLSFRCFLPNGTQKDVATIRKQGENHEKR